jgi:hypothetical protein
MKITCSDIVFLFFSLAVSIYPVFSEQLTPKFKCAGIGGVRVDYQKETGLFTEAEDKMTLQNFTVELNSDHETASLIFIPTSLGKEGKIEKQEYEGKIINLSKESVSIQLLTPSPATAFGLQIYTILPNLQIGFLSSAEPYMGLKPIKVAAESNATLPEASAKTLTFSCKPTV